MPTFDTKRLYSALLNTGLQNKDPALYQVIYQLIGALVGAQTSISSGSSGGSSSSVTNLTNIYQQIVQGHRESSSGIRIIPGPQGLKGDTGAAGATGATLPGPLGIIKHYVEMYPRYTPIQGNQGNPGTTGAQGPMGPAIFSRRIEVIQKTNLILQSVGSSTSSGLVLLEEHAASASPSLDFTARNKNGYTGATFQSDFEEYLIEFLNIFPATDGGDYKLRVSTDGGSTWKTTNYQYAIKYQGPAGGSGVVNSTVDTSFFLLNNVRNTTDGMCGSLKLFNPTGSYSKVFFGDVGGLETDANRYWFDCAFWYVDSTSINAFQTFFSGKNTGSGTVRLYGVTK